MVWTSDYGAEQNVKHFLTNATDVFVLLLKRSCFLCCTWATCLFFKIVRINRYQLNTPWHLSHMVRVVEDVTWSAWNIPVFFQNIPFSFKPKVLLWYDGAVINSSGVCEHPWSLLQCCLREEANARVLHNCLWWSARHLLFIEHTVERFHSRVVSEWLQLSISKFRSLARHGKDNNWKLGINIEVCAFGESPRGNKKGDLFWKIFSCDSSPNIIIQENIF